MAMFDRLLRNVLIVWLWSNAGFICFAARCLHISRKC